MPKTLNEDDLKIYRAAGELFGRLQRKISFGEVSMNVNAASGLRVDYVWRFRARQVPFSISEAVSYHDFELMAEGGLDSYAERIVAKWNESARLQIESKRG